MVIISGSAPGGMTLILKVDSSRSGQSWFCRVDVGG